MHNYFDIHTSVPAGPVFISVRRRASLAVLLLLKVPGRV